MRENEKVLRWFDASLEWLMERFAMRDEEMEKLGQDRQVEEKTKRATIRVMKMKIVDVDLEEVEELIDLHLFIEFS